MAYLLLALVVLVVLLVVFFAGGFGLMRRHREPTPGLDSDVVPERASLRYTVPDGQDPAAVIAALRVAGYDAARDSVGNTNDVVIACEEDTPELRERVRSVIAADAPLNMEGDPMPGQVRFADERW